MPESAEPLLLLVGSAPDERDLNKGVYRSTALVFMGVALITLGNWPWIRGRGYRYRCTDGYGVPMDTVAVDI